MDRVKKTASLRQIKVSKIEHPSKAHRNDGNWFGTGEPVDEIDSLCRGLYFGYQCLKKDHQNCESTRSYDWSIDKNGRPKCGNFDIPPGIHFFTSTF